MFGACGKATARGACYSGTSNSTASIWGEYGSPACPASRCSCVELASCNPSGSEDAGEVVDTVRLVCEKYLRRSIGELEFREFCSSAMRFLSHSLMADGGDRRTAEAALQRLDVRRIQFAMGWGIDSRAFRVLVRDVTIMRPETLWRVARLLSEGMAPLGSIGAKLEAVKGGLAALFARFKAAGLLGGPYHVKREKCEQFGQDGFGCRRSGPPPGSPWFTCDDTGGCAGQPQSRTDVGLFCGLKNVDGKCFCECETAAIPVVPIPVPVPRRVPSARPRPKKPPAQSRPSPRSPGSEWPWESLVVASIAVVALLAAIEFAPGLLVWFGARAIFA